MCISTTVMIRIIILITNSTVVVSTNHVSPYNLVEGMVLEGYTMEAYIKFMVERTNDTREDYANCKTLQECKARSIEILRAKIKS